MDRVNGAGLDLGDLLQAVDRDEPGALDILIDAIYPELKRLAQFQLSRERPGHTLNTTEIVHEAYLRLASGNQAWTGKNHFMRAAARVMRHLLVDHARKKNAEKRVGAAVSVTLQEGHSLDANLSMAVLELDAAISDVGTIDARLESVIECRYFAGLSVNETADALGVSARSVERDWQRARGYILTAMENVRD